MFSRHKRPYKKGKGIRAGPPKKRKGLRTPPKKKEMAVCRVCRRAAGAVLDTGCACPEHHAHASCLTSLCGAQPQKEKGRKERWIACAACGQEYTGAMCKELARVSLKRAKTARPVVTEEVLFAKMYHAYAAAMVGETRVAELGLSRCLASMREKLGPTHHLTLQTAGHLCEVLLGERRLEEAETRSRELYRACVACGTHVDFARSTLARVLRETSKLVEAETLLRACAPTCSTMRSMVILLYRQRRFFEAADYAARSLAMNSAAYGPTHDETTLDLRTLRKIERRIGTGDARCAECGLREPKPKRCACCLVVRYCGAKCQRAHRAKHKADRAEKEAKRADEKEGRECR